MDSGNGNAKLEAIRTAIGKGEISKEEVARRLTYAIAKEYEKEPADRDHTYIIACQKILYEMHTGKPYASRKEESKAALEQRLQKTTDHPVIHIVGRGLVIAAAVAVLVVGLDALTHREWLDGAHSPDEERYTIDGNAVDIGVVSDGTADATDEYMEVETADLETAVSVLGFTPPLPQWLPDGWELLHYYVSKRPSVDRFIATYQAESQTNSLIYQIRYYSNVERASVDFEQNTAGQETSLSDARTVYITNNYENTYCIWYDGLICYSLLSPESSEVSVQIIEEIKENTEDEAKDT